MKTIYTLPAPDTMTALIEVYGDPENAWYEWRIIENGRTVKDTGAEDHVTFKGRGYGQAEIALRDALMFATDVPIRRETTPSKGESSARIRSPNMNFRKEL
jgi:hypothetical protein